MKYMLIMQGSQQDVESVVEWSPEDLRAHIDFMKRIDTELFKPGELVTEMGMAPPNEAKSVRADDDGEAVITDGPFSESKEFLAGVWIVDVDTPERAYELAAHISTAPGPGGGPMNFPVIVHPAGRPPEV